MKHWKFVLAIFCAVIAGCGGGGNSTGNTNVTPADFSGTWSGSYSGTVLVFIVEQTGSSVTNVNIAGGWPALNGVKVTGVVNGTNARLTESSNGTPVITLTATLLDQTSARVTVDSCTPPQGWVCTVAPGTNFVLTRGAATGTLSGVVKNLTGTGLVIASSGQTAEVLPSLQALTPMPDVNFSFASPLAVGASYTVTVRTQPVGQNCTIPGGSGIMPSGNGSSVTVLCESPTPANRFSGVGNYPITDCVKDNNSGLTWEGKPSFGWRADGHAYTNFDSVAKYQVSHVWFGTPYVAPTQAQIDSPTNSIGYKNAVNASGLCGYNNWRMPTAAELQGLLNHGVNSDTIDLAWFPNSVGWHWSSTPNPNGNDDFAGIIDLTYGGYGEIRRFEGAQVQLVR